MNDYALMQTVPVSISASTPEELTAKMIENNAKNNRHFEYFNMTYTGKKWLAWYYVPQRDVMTAMMKAQQVKKTKKKAK
jgi:hypothetical protein